MAKVTENIKKGSSWLAFISEPTRSLMEVLIKDRDGEGVGRGFYSSVQVMLVIQRPGLVIQNHESPPWQLGNINSVN